MLLLKDERTCVPQAQLGSRGRGVRSPDEDEAALPRTVPPAASPPSPPSPPPREAASAPGKSSSTSTGGRRTMRPTPVTMRRVHDDTSADLCQLAALPVLNFKTMCLYPDGDEPIACKPWREGVCEGAEAGPDAGSRLLQHLVWTAEPDPYVHNSTCGDGQRFVSDPEAPPHPPNEHSPLRQRSTSLGSSEVLEETPSDLLRLRRRVHTLKKKIHRFEEDFEQQNKYRPSYSIKAASSEVLRWMNDLERVRKQVKELKLAGTESERNKMTRRRSNTLPKSFGSQRDLESEEEVSLEEGDFEYVQQGSVGIHVERPAIEELQGFLRRAQENRKKEGRPEDLTKMTRDQIAAEKTTLQKVLLHLEHLYGRAGTEEEKHILRPLYERYRIVKQLLSRARNFPTIGTTTALCRHAQLKTLMDSQTAQLYGDIQEEEESEEEGRESGADSPSFHDMSVILINETDPCQQEKPAEFVSPTDDAEHTRFSFANIHGTSLDELLEQLKEARANKKRLKNHLREYDAHFHKENGRSVPKEERLQMEEYHEYKQVKAKLRLLEVLINKNGVV
uniref:protein FAM13A-like isoform X2 n=1 Tax=Myxine glutinosa TaxID=7769 RepID=UPI00358FF18E